MVWGIYTIILKSYTAHTISIPKSHETNAILEPFLHDLNILEIFFDNLASLH